ncbi:hypothetical protein [Bradyrhizobium sp. 192]|uniref:phage tail fiber protein n=1 Tax=Bradyrhizobium sp. 192 TaxID=2782660 RepID=UPI001FFF7072|nr:hypothetical protein [Bradyrhizobium sp. 192]UPJ55399.1 hypothetical protein IVB24_22335 [Bradyrhizobium sp. 192]
MGDKGTTFCNDWLKLIFNGTAIANIADNAASSPLATLYFALHTADPGVGGAQTTSECAYTSYARAAVLRTPVGFTVAGTSVTPVNDVNFPIATCGSETATYWSVGTAANGAGKILYRGALSPAIAISNGVPPVVHNSTSITES